MSYRAFDVRRIAGALGAELAGVDLSEPLDDAVIADIRRALLDHQVIFSAVSISHLSNIWLSAAALAA